MREVDVTNRVRWWEWGTICLWKSSWIKGILLMIGGSGWGILPKSDPGKVGAGRASSPKPMSGIGQEEGTGPKVVRVRQGKS